ncbi:DUF2059 domain-containing protein [Maricaulis sp.]|uniref:DUF2059 domain-containing protein n=1 Tax=Maricaulis sp. TaxID=1486257 RepID=UPI002B2745CF|nr:DUF2059 domain-containing protein [Maricaulis sp.]
MRVLIVAVVAILAWLPLSTAAAQDVATERQLELAREIVAGTSNEAMFEIALQPMLPLLRQSFAASVPGATEAQLDRAMEIVMDVMLETYPDIAEATAIAYANRFTEAELAELLAFYETDLGQKLAVEQPALMSEMAQVGELLGQHAMQRNMARLLAAFE